MIESEGLVVGGSLVQDPIRIQGVGSQSKPRSAPSFAGPSPEKARKSQGRTGKPTPIISYRHPLARLHVGLGNCVKKKPNRQVSGLIMLHLWIR